MKVSEIIIGLVVGTVFILYAIGSIVAAIQGLNWLYSYLKAYLFT